MAGSKLHPDRPTTIQGSLVTLELVVFAPAIPTARARAAARPLFSRKRGWVIRLVLHP